MQQIYLSLEEKDLTSFIFKNDGHWNEKGHKLAAETLFKELSK